MKKLISIITSGMLAVMPAVQIQFSAVAVDTDMTAASEEATVIENAENFIQPQTDAIQDNQTGSLTTTPISDGEIRAFFEYDDSGEILTVNIGEKLDLNKVILRIKAYGIDSAGNQYKAEADELNYNFSIGSGRHSDCYNYDTSQVDNADKAGIYYIYIEPNPHTTDKFVLENSVSEELPDGEYEFTIRNEYHNGGEGDFYIPVNVVDPTAPPVTTQAPPADGEIRANLEAYGSVPPLYVGEGIDLDKVNLSIGAWGFDSDGEWYEVQPRSLNYNFSIGSGKHSGCYTYDLSDVDTSEAGLYYIHVKAVPGAFDKFVLENSLSSELPNGTYKLVMQERSFDIPVEFIDPSVLPSETAPQYTGTVTTTITTTTVGTGIGMVGGTTSPVTQKIKGYVVPEEYCYFTSVGEEFDLDTIKPHLQLIIVNSDGSEKYCLADCDNIKDFYEINADDLDTSKLGLYKLTFKSLGGTTEKINIKNTYHLPDGEYEIEMESETNDISIMVTNDAEHLTTTATTLTSAENPTTTTTATTMVTTTVTSTEPKKTLAPNELTGSFYAKTKQGRVQNIDDVEIYLTVKQGHEDGSAPVLDSGYKFTIGSGKHSDCYKINDYTLPDGTHIVKIETLEGAVDKFNLENCSSEYINEEYCKPDTEIKLQYAVSTIYIEYPHYTTTTCPQTTQMPDENTTTTTTTTNIQDIENYSTEDYPTNFEYDSSPMKKGETRAIHLSDNSSKVYISEASPNISVSYTEGSDVVYITALEAGDIKLYIRNSGSAFGNYVNLTATDELYSEPTETEPVNTTEADNVTTTAIASTTQPEENLPQTGYSNIYKFISAIAVIMTAAGSAVMIFTKKKES